MQPEEPRVRMLGIKGHQQQEEYAEVWVLLNYWFMPAVERQCLGWI
jgi:hypothetical protein